MPNLHIRLSFFNDASLKDPEGELEKQGPSTRQPHMIRFAKNDQVAQMKTVFAKPADEIAGIRNHSGLGLWCY